MRRNRSRVLNRGRSSDGRYHRARHPVRHLCPFIGGVDFRTNARMCRGANLLRAFQEMRAHRGKRFRASFREISAKYPLR